MKTGAEVPEKRNRILSYISTSIFIAAALAGIFQLFLAIFPNDDVSFAQTNVNQEVCRFNDDQTKIICAGAGGGFADGDGATAYDFEGGTSASGQGYGTGSRPGETYGFVTREDGAICVVRSNASNVDLICN